MMPGICQLRLDFNTLQLSVGDSDPVRVRVEHRSNMQFYLQSLFGLLCTLYSCTHWLRPRSSAPSTVFWLIYAGTIRQTR
jgi:hypothetical protein